MPTHDLGTILVQSKKLTKKQYETWQKKALQKNTPLDQLIAESGLVSPEDLAKAQAQALGFEYVDLLGMKIKREVLHIIPQQLSENYKMLPIEIDKERTTLTVAMINPLDIKAREVLRYIGREHKFKILYVITTEESLKTGLKQYANLSEEVGKALKSARGRFKEAGDTDDEETETIDQLQEVVKHAPVAKMVSVILRHAAEGKASDIHIEPLEDQTRVRYRIDGELKTTLSIPLYVHDALVARVKVMANLKIDEMRIPQDGRIRISLPDRDVEFRVSTLPLQNHEKVVMRVLDTGGAPPAIDKLGYAARNFETVDRNIKKPNGMILVTGPTGSGKSMTLFSALNIINREDINISTLEDPVEYRLPGINQSQMRPNVGFTFASGLRSLLRQDPDVILVGEIRDLETAELAIHAAMTGHVVFSTLHTNSAIDSIPRFLDMKVEPYLIATTLNVIMAQRLVRRICADCKEEVSLEEAMVEELIKEVRSIPPEILKGYGDLSLEKPVFYRGKGCAKCGHSGEKGRTAITEVVEITKSMRHCMTSGMKAEDVQKALEEQHFITMKQDGIIKVLMGITTHEQVLAVTKEET